MEDNYIIMRRKEQMLSHSYLTEVLDYNAETGKFVWKKPASYQMHPGDEAGTQNASGYVFICVGGVKYKAHRLVWFYHYGEWPSDETPQIDHINGNRADNRIANLRLVTRVKNSRNHKGRSTNTSGCTGVSFKKSNGKWQAVIGDGHGKYKLLGYFLNYEEAVAARKQAEKEYGYTVRKEG